MTMNFKVVMILKGEFNGWKNSMGEDELSNQDPTR